MTRYPVVRISLNWYTKYRSIAFGTLARQLAAIAVLALLVRLVLLIFAYPTWEQGMTLESEAKSLLEGNGYSLLVTTPEGETQLIPSVYDMPGFPLILAGTWKLTGSQSFLWIQSIQIILDVMMIFLIYRTIEPLMGSRIGILSALLYSIYLPQATAAVQPMRDVWATFGTISSVAMFLQSVSYTHLTLPTNREV